MKAKIRQGATNSYAVKEKHIQNGISPAVILPLKNQLFDNMGKVQNPIFQPIGGVKL